MGKAEQDRLKIAIRTTRQVGDNSSRVRGLPLTRIVQRAFINVQDCKQMLEFLVEKKYVQKTLSGKRFLFKLTNIGLEFVYQAKKLLLSI